MTSSLQLPDGLLMDKLHHLRGTRVRRCAVLVLGARRDWHDDDLLLGGSRDHTSLDVGQKSKVDAIVCCMIAEVGCHLDVT